jgi:hypothetical protein
VAVLGWRYLGPVPSPERTAALTKFARRALPVMDRLARQGIFYDDFDDPCDVVFDFLTEIGADPDRPAEEALPLLEDKP